MIYFLRSSFSGQALLSIGLSLSTALGFSYLSPQDCKAQGTSVGKALETEGISGYVDAHHRSPMLSFRVENADTPKRVKILVDTAIINKQFEEFPVRVDFYVNRELYKSQMRSIELPGPLGIEVPETFATAPFNFSIVATLLHPNRQYITVAHGAAFASNLTATLDCSVSIINDSLDQKDLLYVANEIQTNQTGNENFKLTFEAREASSGEKLQFSADVALGSEISVEDDPDLGMPGDDDNLDDLFGDDSDSAAASQPQALNTETAAASIARSATATALIQISGSSTSAALSGDVSLQDGAVSAIDLESSDSSISISCQ